MHNFFTFEGGEGVGKSTLISNLEQALKDKGHTILKTHEPGGSPLGGAIRNLLLQRKEISISKRAELLLFLADRAQHVEEIILPTLKKGQIVLCDRFTDSTLAYQGAARGGFDKDDLHSFCQFAAFHIEPERTFLLDLDPKIGLERIKKERNHITLDRIEEEDLLFHQEVRNAFLKIANFYPKRITVLDATKSPKALTEEALTWISKA